MKTGNILNGFRSLIIASALLLSLCGLSSCRHNANMEDDTFRESTIDDPARHLRKTQEKDRKDSIEHKDTNRVKENATY